MEIRQKLLSTGILCDLGMAHRYADETLDRWVGYAGIRPVPRLSRWLGPYLALALGIAQAGLRRLLRPRSRRGPAPIEALTHLIAACAYAGAAFSASFQLDRARDIEVVLRPLGRIRGRLPRAAHLLCVNFLRLPVGKWQAVLRSLDEILTIAERDRLTPLTDIDRRLLEGTCWYTRAYLAAHGHRPEVSDAVRVLDEELDLRFFQVGGLVSRTLFHRMRGEEEQARELEDELELRFVQAGSMWMMEAQLVWGSSLAYATCRDVVGLRRTTETLARYVEAGRLPAFLVELSRGEYLRERGDHDDAREALERALSGLPEEDRLFRQVVVAALAETHLALGEPDACQRYAREAVRLGEDAESGQLPQRLRAGQALALSWAAEGRTEEAGRYLEGLIPEAEALRSPSLGGALHEARARVALLEGDGAAFAFHTGEVDRWFRPTRNPALIRRAERLRAAREEGRPSTSQAPSAEVTQAAVTVAERGGKRRKQVSTALQQCRGPAERAARCLELLMEDTGAAAGYLFLARGRALELAATRTLDPRSDAGSPASGSQRAGGVASHHSDVAVGHARRAALEALAEASASSDRSSGGQGDSQAASLRVALLRPGGGRNEVTIGAAVLVPGAVSVREPDPALLDVLASRLYEVGDAVSVTRAPSVRGRSSDNP
jgi:tetratricopeptide (TPR) repeat protein